MSLKFEEYMGIEKLVIAELKEEIQEDGSTKEVYGDVQLYLVYNKYQGR